MSREEESRAVVLLVEDNATIRDAFAILLQENGYEVLHAGSGSVALKTATERAPDLILLDLGLPDMEGLDVVRTLKGQDGTREIPVVALTGRALATDERACREAGCDGYLTKPINTLQLLEAIPSFLGREA